MADDFSLVRGGPFHRLMRAAGLARDDRWDPLRQSAAAIAVAWLPFALLARAGEEGHLLDNFALHARLLVAIPCFLVAESSLHVRTCRCIGRLLEDGWAPGQEGAVRAIAGSIERARDAALPELVLLLGALAVGQAHLWGHLDPVLARAVSWGEVTRAPALFWYGVVALPLFQFLAARWLWRWALWTLALFRISRLHLRPVATHPDERGGFVFLSEPSVGFSWVVLGNSAVLAGAGANRILHAGVGIDALVPHALALLGVAQILCFGPTFFFVRCLWRTRFAAIRDYGRLAAGYTRGFERRWIPRIGDEALLGSPDIQSLADLANSYAVLQRMRVVPVTRRALLVVAVAALGPMVALALIDVPLTDLLRDVGSTWLGLGPLR